MIPINLPAQVDVDLKVNQYRKSITDKGCESFTFEYGGDRYFFKPHRPEYPNLVPIEFLCNQIAETLALNVAPYTVVQANDLQGFVSLDVRHLYPGDEFIHAFDIFEQAEFGLSELLSKVLYYTKSVEESQLVADIVLFDALIGNFDRHLWNLAFLGGNTRTVAPLFDNQSYLGVTKEKPIQGKIRLSEDLPFTFLNVIKELNSLGYSLGLAKMAADLKEEILWTIDFFGFEDDCKSLLRSQVLKELESAEGFLYEKHNSRSC